MVRFDEVLDLLDGGEVDARGPLDSSKEKMVELCAWVFSRGDNDAAATEMTTTGRSLEFVTEKGEIISPQPQAVISVQNRPDIAKWRLVLGKVPGDGADLQGGDAFAVAVALMQIKDDKQRVVWWGHPVELRTRPAAASGNMTGAQ